MDSIWCRVSREPFYKSAIFHRISVRHTRPIGRSLRGAMKESGIDANVEGETLRARYDLRGRTRPLIYAGIDEKGRLREGCRRLGLAMALGYLGAHRQFTVQESAIWKILQLLKRQFSERLDLSPIERTLQAAPSVIAEEKS